MLAVLFVLWLGGPQRPALRPIVRSAALSAARPTQSEVIAAIQIHGNTATPDDEIRKLAGIEAGAPFQAATIDEVAARLRATKRFDRVQVLKRFASIADPSQILLVIIVDEGPVKVELTRDAEPKARVVRTRPLKLMYLPILGWEDGYGFTYGIRVARPDIAGANSRLSFPLTWGGDKKAGVELEKSFARGPLHRVIGGASIGRRTNPFFDEEDSRRRVWIRGERQLVPYLRAGATAGWQHVSFFDRTDDVRHAGADVVLDTRVDPLLPRNAVFARAAWERLWIDSDLARWDLEARGYVGLFGQTVLAVRGLRQDSNRPLPLYLKPLLGGAQNLRGFATATFAGDTLVAASAEIVQPLTSALSIGKIGVSAFVDAGTAYEDGAKFSDQTLQRGYGGSVWFSAAFLRLNVAVAHGRGSSTRVHVTGNVVF